MSNWVLQCQNVGKSYVDGQLNVTVLANLNLQVAAGKSVSSVGASGSGKSTLLHILGGLDTPSEGRVTLLEQDLAGLSQTALGQLRNRHLGLCINSTICCLNFRRWKM